jgi:hypothetical protein
LLTHLHGTLQDAVRMGFLHSSRPRGRVPRGLKAAADVRYIGHAEAGANATLLRFEVAPFGEAAAEMGAAAYLLDTGIVLVGTRQSSASKVIDAQFGLSASPFRPAICEVSIGELLAFARSNKWGERRQKLLMERLES